MTIKYTKKPEYPQVDILGATAYDPILGNQEAWMWKPCILTEKKGFARDFVAVDDDGEYGYQLLSVEKFDTPVKVYVKMAGGFKSAAFATFAGDLWVAEDPMFPGSRMVVLRHGEFRGQIDFLAKLWRRMSEAYPESGDLYTLVDENDRSVVLCEFITGDQPID